ncbi:2-C-methyl-D-erythritol 2,4-cyclodiphosphate synthase [Gracilimonas sp. BCB1]|uniref:2-C-methyl-D-erythritol 2,4-cyclodiphosphate synthase n=1 Tax=Gracilimonas sp. BCB1 TaxID=3152362 RepID=UPI0032D9AC4B
MRIGYGYDVHRFSEGRKLMLGGVEIPHDKGLLGHSDADVLLHAITDALLGSLALGDIGSHFPDTDPEFKNVDSRELLRKSYELIKEKGYRLGNLDATVIAEQPKLRPYIDDIRKTIAEDLGCSIDDISVKATTSEKMGFAGREEGIIAQAVVLIQVSG